MNILIRNAIVIPMTSRGEYFRGNIGVSGRRIAFVEREGEGRAARFGKEHGDVRVIDGREMLAMPGLVNIHNHCAMTIERSYADDLDLMSWLNDYIWPLEARLNRDDIELGSKIGMAEMLLGGTTTFVDMYWSEEAVAEAVKESGIRAVLSPTFTDKRWEDFTEDYRTVFDRYGGGSEERISLMIAPHSAYSCSGEHLLEARRLADRHGVGINIHVAETRDEVDIIRARHGVSPVRYLYDLGLLDSRSIAVHCVHVSDEDIELLRETGCSVAHNPHSNMKLASGAAPVWKMAAAGVNVGIGTDGPSSNNDLDMWEESRTASFLQKMTSGDPTVLPACEVLEMATVNGAKAVGKENEIGRLAEGMLADIVLIDTRRPHLYPRHDMIANLVYAGKSTDVDTVIVNGEIVVEKGRLLTMDTDELCGRMQGRVEEILRR